MASFNKVLVELHYLPSVEFMALILGYGRPLIEAHETYQKQTYRNRCRILGPNGVQELSVPVIKPIPGTPIREVRIDNGQKWRDRHWRSIQSSYGRAPFFEYFKDDFHSSLYSGHHFLWDLNLDLLETILTTLQVTLTLEQSATYLERTGPDVMDARGQLKPQNEYPLPEILRSVPYHQIFGNKFVPRLSILDLIFCQGGHSLEVLDRCLIRS